MQSAIPYHYLHAMSDADLRELIYAAEAELADRHSSREAERRWQTVLPLDADVLDRADRAAVDCALVPTTKE